MVNIKRVYLPPSAEDGFRILVDRLWPRNMTKERACADIWLREIAPGTELRKWFGHDPAKWQEFQLRYRQELSEKAALLEEIRNYEKIHGMVTLLYAARDEVHNNAVVIKSML